MRIPRLLTVLTVLLAGFGVIAGCRELPEPIGVGPHPAEPRAGAGQARYQSITDGMQDYQIVQPKPWGSVNERVAPKKK